MTAEPTKITPQLYNYILAHSQPEHPTLKKINEHIAGNFTTEMQISPDEGHFLQMLVKLMGATNILEIGTFLGYSALAIGLALPENGKLLTLEIDAEFVEQSRAYWEEAGVSHKIDAIAAPAHETLAQLLADGKQSTFDFIFIDADKGRYDQYYEQALQLVRPNGLIGIDNVFWCGKVAMPENNQRSTNLMRAFNEKLVTDPRIEYSIVTIGDGLTLCRRKS